VGGIEAAKTYRLLSLDCDPVPLVALTADTTVETRRRCEEAGFAAFVPKPFEAKRLLETIGEIAAARSASAPGAAKAAEAVPLTVETLDPEVLEDLVAIGANEAFVQNLIRLFLEGTEKKLAEMEGSLRASDPEGYRLQAHALKGAAGQIGAFGLAAMADVHAAADDALVLREGREMVARIRGEFGRVKEKLSGRFRQAGSN
jgi:two-component system sensor histidine kinase RpfC